jgi:hypothetical protein
MKPKPGSFLIPAVLVALIVTTLAVISCSKNNSGKPTLSLVSINTTVQVNDSMRVTFKFTDGGAVSNNNLWWIRTRLNTVPPTDSSGADTTGYQLPSFTGHSGEIYISLPWQGYLSTSGPVSDTDMFRFYLTNANDSAISDTVKVPQIIVLEQ